MPLPFETFARLWKEETFESIVSNDQYDFDNLYLDEGYSSSFDELYESELVDYFFPCDVDILF